MKVIVNLTNCLILCLVISGCMVYRDKYFVPVDYYDNYEGDPTTFIIDTFENWDITIDFVAYFRNGGVKPNGNNFGVSIIATTFDKKLDKYRDTEYKVNNQYLFFKVFFGKNLKNEVKTPKAKYYYIDKNKANGRYVSLSPDPNKIFIPPEIKSVTVVSEIEFIDENNNIVLKKFVVPMKLKKSSSMWLPSI